MGKQAICLESRDDFLSRLRYAVPGNKFAPPRLAPSPYLFRANLIREVLQKRGQGAKIFLFEGQGGQGKTTLAAQYLYDSHHNFAWYQLGPEDGDPLFFLTAILFCLKEAVPCFSSPLLEEMVVSGELKAIDLPGLVNSLLADLRRDLPGDFFMVFDDLHLLEDCKHSLHLLDVFLNSSPPQLRFILLSRRPVRLQSKQLRYGNGVLRLNNQDLFLAADEAERLMTDILDLKLPKDAIAEIHRITDGWIMGVLLAGQALALRKDQPQRLEDVRKAFRNQNIHDFFYHEVFAQLPDDYRTSLMKLSLLEEVLLDLAVEITGDSGIGTKLCHLVDGNYFAVNCDQDQEICGFHPLFRVFLQERANKEFTAQEKTKIYQVAIKHSVAGKRISQALRYCASAENYEVLEQILMTEGIGFLAMNRGATLLTILLAVPREIQFRYGWIALFIGLAFSEFAPEKCCEHLEQARKVFWAKQEEGGELLALSQLILFSWVVAANLKMGAVLLPRAEELYHRLEAQLPLFAKAVVARNIAAGYCYFHGDMIAAHRYSSVARELAMTLQSKGLEASVVLVQSYENFLLGRRKINRVELERAYGLLLDPQVATAYKMGLGSMLIDDLQLHGDFANYSVQKEHMLALVTHEILSRTIVGPFLYVWDIGILVSQGKLRDALAKMDEGIRSGPVAETPHMLSQFLHWKALILAHLDEPEAALKAARKSLLLRGDAGGPFYDILNRILVGTVFARVGLHEKAEEILTQALAEAKKYRLLYLRAVCLLHRANAYRLAGNIEAAVHDTGEGLRFMKENDYGYVLGLTPKKLENVLQLAVQHNVEVEYACGIAQERLRATFAKGGRVVPLLSVRMCGGFHLELGGQILLAADEMTPLQCRLLKLLATSDTMKMGQEAIQLAFWPESKPEKARSNFDSLLSRLRKSLRSVMGQYPVEDYLVLQQGILSLQNSVLDAKRFQQAAAKGLRHAKKNEWWQAANCFEVAVSLWQGSMGAWVIEDDQVHNFVGELQRLMIEVASTWGEYLASASRADQALVVLQKGLKIDPTELNLVRLTYRLHRREGDLMKAKTLLKEYEQHLIAEGLVVPELQLMLSEIVA